MKKLLVLGIPALFVFLMSFRNTDPLFHRPEGWPAPVYDFTRNPLSAQKIEIGRLLFYDPVLSKDSTISCASCHAPFTAFAQADHGLSHGIGGRPGTRNATALMNLAWSKSFMWDGAVNHLDMQPLAPISNPLEMDESIAHVVDKLQATRRYPALFYEAFGDSVITGEHVLKSLSQFMLTLVSAGSKYDRVKGGKEKFTGEESAGYHLFRQHCASCHTEPLFTSGGFENNGLVPDAALPDAGQMKVTHLRSDSLKFKVPTLRNIEYSYPYMHDGRFETLGQVLNNYIMGIDHSPTLSAKLKNGMFMNASEKAELIAFLRTLTDEEFLHNPKFSNPRN